MPNKIMVDTQIIFANFAPHLDKNPLEKNIISWGEISSSGDKIYISEQTFSEIIWLLFRKTYKKIGKETGALNASMTAKGALGVSEVRVSVAKEIIYPFLNAMQMNGVKLFSEYAPQEIIEILVEYGIDINDILISSVAIRHNMKFVTNDESLNKWLKKKAPILTMVK